MSNNPKFSYQYYKEMVGDAIKTHKPIFFHEVKENTEKSILIRHDIDLSVRSCYEMAKIEADLGAKASYFLRLNSSFYNVFSQHEFPLVKEILDMGHEIGLHFDSSFYQANNIEIAEGILREMNILSEGFDTKVVSISQHRPFSLSQIKGDDTELFKYYTYNKEFFEDYKYISDSGQNWREGDLKVHLPNNDHIQMLVHPVWWTESGTHWKTCLKDLAKVSSDIVLDKAEVLEERFQEYLDKRKVG